MDTSGRVLPLSNRQGCSAEGRKIDPTWDSLFDYFCKKLRKMWPWMRLKFQNFLNFFPQFSQKDTLRADEGLWFVYFSVFTTLPWTHRGQKSYPDQRHIPVPFFAQVSPPPWVLDTDWIWTRHLSIIGEIIND